MRILTEKDYKVMTKILNRKENKGLSKQTGLTRKELQEATSLSYSKVRDALKSLIEYGFVDVGIAKGKERTYYLTMNGINELKDLSKSVINIREGNINE